MLHEGEVGAVVDDIVEGDEKGEGRQREHHQDLCIATDHLLAPLDLVHHSETLQVLAQIARARRTTRLMRSRPAECYKAFGIREIQSSGRWNGNPGRRAAHRLSRHYLRLVCRSDPAAQ